MSKKLKTRGDRSEKNKITGLFFSLGLHLAVIVCLILLMFAPKPKENYVLLELIPLGDLVAGEEAEPDQQASQEVDKSADSTPPQKVTPLTESAPKELPHDAITKSDAIGLNLPSVTPNPPPRTIPPRQSTPRPTVTARSTPTVTKTPITPSPTPTKRPTLTPNVKPTPRPSPRQTPSPTSTPTRTNASSPVPRATPAAPQPTAAATRPVVTPSRTSMPANPSPRTPPPTLPPAHTSTSATSSQTESSTTDTAQAIRERLARRVGRTGVSGPEQTGQSGTRNPANLGPEVAAFYGHVRDVYHRAWRQPVREPSGHTAVLRIRVSRDGKILQSVLISPSGNSAMDESVRTAARNVTSLGRPVPEALSGETVEVSITFEY